MKTYRQLAMGLLALMICITLPSCSDDDDNETQKKEAIQEAQRGMVELLNLQMNLCLINQKGQPTEATFGHPWSATNTTERIYYTKDLNSAKKRFQSLFHSDTRHSEDGCTYTLANEQGTATFAEANGNKGELAVATFNVPGLKGLVTKIHFYDYTQRGTNSSGDKFRYLEAGSIVRVSANDTEWCGIALGPLKGSDDTWVLFTPSIQKDLENYAPTGFINKTMIQDNSEGISIMDYIESYDEEEFENFFINMFCFLFTPELGCSDTFENEMFLEQGYLYYWRVYWDKKTFSLQVAEEEMTDSYINTIEPGPGEEVTDAEFVWTYTRYHALLRKYESRTKLWPITRTITETYYSQEYKIESSGWPKDFRRSLPLWTTLTTVTKGDQIEFLE